MITKHNNLMRNRLIISFFVFIMIFMMQDVNGQKDTVNQVDQKGKKHGYWKKIQNDTLMYEGRFDHGNPTGLFVYYYGNKIIKSTVYYTDSGRDAKTVMYHPNGSIMAMGKYYTQKKDSLWRYYNEQEVLVSSEQYQMGVAEGEWLKYNSSGKVIERVIYRKGLKEGDWFQYFDDGKVKLKGFYKSDLLEGNFLLYYSNGVFCVAGKYEKSLPVGVWLFYNIKGEVERKDTYKAGRRIKTEQLIPVVEPASEEALKEVDAFRRQLRNMGIE
jgi:antitoxin component YwqK of YwqJK toxin-antitoxin module